MTRAEARCDTVRAADLYFRRNVWLIVFGVIHAYLLLWIGEILYGYGVTALVLFVFRKMGPRKLLVAGLVLLAVLVPKRIHHAHKVAEISEDWTEGVRRFSYRRWPDIPSSMPQVARDNVLIALNAIPMGQDGRQTHLPGRMPKFVWYKTTDYEFALNRVAQEHGGGTEIWRTWLPGMTYKHFYPRQPKSEREGPAEGKLEIRYEPGTRIVECALPWGEIPDVKMLRDAGRSVKFSFRVNHQTRGPDMELPIGRSAAEGLSPSFHPNWAPHWPNELEFGFE